MALVSLLLKQNVELGPVNRAAIQLNKMENRLEGVLEDVVEDMAEDAAEDVVDHWQTQTGFVTLVLEVPPFIPFTNFSASA